MSTAEVWVRSSSMKDYAGRVLELGEVFNLGNQLHDDKLLDLRYVVLVGRESKDGIEACIGCGKRFINTGFRNSHAARAQHEAIQVDGPQLKSPKYEVGVAIEGADRELEPIGAPPPRPVEGDLAADRGSQRGTRSAGSKADETFRLGG